ncbi:MAG: hypothetical protein JWQ97_3383 [Phenylobacterium sp.]|nr:hypothetical protein [Phenylobacterium sp.]
MAETLPAAPKPQIMAGGQVAALIPQSLEEAFRVSQAIALSGLAPRGIDKAEQIMVAIMAGAELGLAPFQSLQSFAVVNGRPTLWGDGLLAVVRGRGVKVREWLDGEGDNMVARCECTRPDSGEQIEREFSVADAKKAGLWGKAGPWQQYPKRMLQMRARALSLRDGCADMLRGIQVREEVDDYQPIRNVTPEPSGLVARLAAGKATASEGFTSATAAEVPHDPVTGEIVDAEDAVFVENAEAIAAEGAAELVQPEGQGDAAEADATAAEGQEVGDFPGDRKDPPLADDDFDVVGWADKLEADLPDYAGVDVLRGDWNEHKDQLKAKAPDVFKRVNLAIAKRAEEIAKASKGAGDEGQG